MLLNCKAQIRLIVLKYAKHFSEKWLPKIKSVERTIEAAYETLDSDASELSLSSDSYSLECARNQYIAVSRLCGELYEDLVSCDASMVPLFPSGDYLPLLSHSHINESANFSVGMKDNVIVIRMPYPMKRYSKKNIVSPALDIFKDKLSCFYSGHKQSIPMFGDNIFYFWYVYPLKGEGSGWYYPDNDNYLVKPIIDVICETLGFQDKGTNTFLFHATMLTSEISEGAYALIVPQSDEAHDFRRQKNVADFITYFGRG